MAPHSSTLVWKIPWTEEPGRLQSMGSLRVGHNWATSRSFFFNFILFLNFTILYWFCQISKWIHHRYTCVPYPEPSSLLPPHTILLGRPSAPAPSIQYHDFTFTFHFHALEKEMANHSSVLAWRIPGTGKPGGLPSMGSHIVGHDWSDLAATAAE